MILHTYQILIQIISWLKRGSGYKWETANLDNQLGSYKGVSSMFTTAINEVVLAVTQVVSCSLHVIYFSLYCLGESFHDVHNRMSVTENWAEQWTSQYELGFLPNKTGSAFLIHFDNLILLISLSFYCLKFVLRLCGCLRRLMHTHLLNLHFSGQKSLCLEWKNNFIFPL